MHWPIQKPLWPGFASPELRDFGQALGPSRLIRSTPVASREAPAGEAPQPDILRWLPETFRGTSKHRQAADAPHQAVGCDTAPVAATAVPPLAAPTSFGSQLSSSRPMTGPTAVSAPP